MNINFIENDMSILEMDDDDSYFLHAAHVKWWIEKKNIKWWSDKKDVKWWSDNKHVKWWERCGRR